MSAGSARNGEAEHARGREPLDMEGARRPWEWGGLVVLAALFAVLVGPMVWLEAGRTDIPAARGMGYPGEVMDQDLYHWKVVQDMEAQWPVVNVVSYDSATTPGYHWVMAGVLRVTGRRAALLALNAMLGFGLVASVWWGAAGLVGGWRAVALAAPVMASPYVLGGSIWLTTDNASLMFVSLVLGLAVLRRFTLGRAGWMGLFGTGAVLVRQIHVWPVAVVGLAGLLRSPLARFAPSALRDEERQSPRDWRYLGAAVMAAGVPVLVVGVFMVLWGGLLPKSDWIRGFHAQGVNPAAPALGLTVAGAYGLFLLGLAWGEVRRIRVGDWALWGAGVAGALAGAAVQSDYLRLRRDYGWVWMIVRRVGDLIERVAPGVAGLHRSPVIIAGAAFGAVVVLLLYRGARSAGNRTPALMLLLALLGWLGAQTANTMAWQRYFDPITLIGLAMLGALCVSNKAHGSGEPCHWGAARWAWAGPVVLAIGQVLLAGATMYREFLGKVL